MATEFEVDIGKLREVLRLLRERAADEPQLAQARGLGEEIERKLDEVAALARDLCDAIEQLEKRDLVRPFVGWPCQESILLRRPRT